MILNRVLLSILIALTLTITVFSQVSTPDGDLRPMVIENLYPNKLSSNFANEFWTYYFLLNDDIQVNIVFSTAGFGRFKSSVGGARLTLAGFNGEEYNVSREAPLGDLEFREKDFFFRPHKRMEMWFEGDLKSGSHRVRYNTTKNDITYDVDIELTQLSEGWQWGDGIFRMDGERIGIVMAIPKARASGTISINGEKKQVVGTAYMDHTWQTNISSRIFNNGYKYLFHDNDGWESGYFATPGKSTSSHVVGYGIRLENGKNPVLLRPELITVDATSRVRDVNVPSRMGIYFVDQDHISLRRIQDNAKYSFLGELSGFQHRIAKTFLGGELHEYIGNVATNNNRRGFYNFFVVD
jgi:hypothetical protein